MKKSFLLLFGVILTTSLFSQSLIAPTKWKIKKVGVSFGFDEDMISNLDYRYMLSTAKDLDTEKFAGLSFDPEDLYSGVCENPYIRVNVALEVPRLKNVELNVGGMAVFDRYDGVYYSTNNSNWAYLNPDYQYLSINSFNNEVALESSITKRFTAWNAFNLYAGVGTNIGYSYGGRLEVSGHNVKSVDNNIDRTPNDIVAGIYDYEDVYDSYELKDGLHQRAYVQLGMSFTLLKRLELGLDYRGGLGYRAMQGVETKKTRLNSIGTSIRWILK